MGMCSKTGCVSNSGTPSVSHDLGPKDTAYEGGFFVVDIELGMKWWVCIMCAQGIQYVVSHTAMLYNYPPADNQYPFVPPKMRFRTKVWYDVHY